MLPTLKPIANPVCIRKTITSTVNANWGEGGGSMLDSCNYACELIPNAVADFI